MRKAYYAPGDGIVFGPNGSGKRYISLNYHRGTPTKNKSTWSESLTRRTEFRIFCSADTGAWFDTRGNYWGIRDKGNTVLGTRGERIAKFPANGNPTLPWHGYPASPNRKGAGDTPPNELVKKWEDDGHISRPWARRLRKDWI
jgi:hypothetical protein